MKLFRDTSEQGPSHFFSEKSSFDVKEKSREEKNLEGILALRVSVEELFEKFSASKGDQSIFFNQDISHLQSLLTVLAKSEFLTTGFFQKEACDHPVIGKYVEHDLVSISSAVLSEIGTLGELNLELSADQDCLYAMCKEYVFVNILRYLRVLEDNFLRVLKSSDFPPEVFDYSILGTEIEALEYGRSMKSHGKVLIPDIQVRDQAKDVVQGRRTLGRAGLVDNFVINCINNALREQVGATHIEVSFFIDENTQELVYQVKDDGVGIPTHMFEASTVNEIRLFETGVSESKSTGLGMSDANLRFPEYGGKLALWSIREGQRNMWKSKNFGAEDGNFPEILAQGTLFEIRFPLVASEI